MILRPNATKFAVALVTAPNLKTARKLARAALEARLVACANLLPNIESHYFWQGKIATDDEVLILFKTTKAKTAALEKLIVVEHPYDTPEFILVSVTGGNKRYLDWVRECCRGATKANYRNRKKSGC